MKFTYSGYIELINLLKKNDYQFCNYLNYDKHKKVVILRHDIDTSLHKAIELAKLENEIGVSSTYFVLLSTNFYNIFSKESNIILSEITKLGHGIGLHFDEKRYEISGLKKLEYYVQKECEILGIALGTEIKLVSMHRPSKWIIDNNIQFEKIINTYSKRFFSDFKYLSDSRMHWREDVLSLVVNDFYDRLHILTHPFWYSNYNETIDIKIKKFINTAKLDRYKSLKDNFRNLDEIIKEGEI